MSVYGYDRKTTPRIEEFARDAMVFEDAYSSSGWTKPAVATLLSGLSPPRHGAITRNNALPGSIKTLGEYLKPLGYECAAVITNPNIIPEWGFDQGFDPFYDVRRETGNRHVDADTVNDWIARYLDGPHHEPFFLYVHTLDPHSPYEPPPPFDAMFGAPDAGQKSPANITAETPLDVVEGTVSRYDGEIAFNDEQFGVLINDLKARGLYEDALIIFVSDHGEEFVDHGFAGHGHTLFQELVRVPMIIKWPGNERAGTRVDARAALIDVVPTILRMLGEEPPSRLEGTSLLPVLSETQSPLQDRPLFFDLDLVRANSEILNVSKGVLSGPYKYIQITSPAERELLFDLSNDPREQRNLLAGKQDLARQLSVMVTAYHTASKAGVHLRIYNADDIHDRVIAGVLKTKGRFTGLQLCQAEETDHADLQDEASTIRFTFKLVNGPHPTRGKPKWLVDCDQLSFQVVPVDAAVNIEELHSDKDAEVPVYAGLSKRRVDPLPVLFHQSDETLVVPEVNALFRRGDRYDYSPPRGAYLTVVMPVERTEVPIESLSPSLRKSLEALGYVRGAENDRAGPAHPTSTTGTQRNGRTEKKR